MGTLIDFPRFPAFETLWDSLSQYEYSSGSRGQYHFVEGEDESILYVCAPGYKADDLTVEMHEGRLSVTGKPSTERSLGVLVPKQISLRFSVPTNMLVENAEFTDGILAIKITKPAKTESLRIPVKTT